MSNKMDEAQKKYFGIYADKLVEAQQMMLDEINRIIEKQYEEKGHRPAEHVLSRIKSTESAKRKQQIRGIKPGSRAGIIWLSDIIGCRIVTHFLGDVYVLADEFKKSSIFKVCKVKDYIKKSKPNGYRSYHMLVSLPFGIDGIETITAEIQMRTIAMDCWAALEHQLKYKKKIDDVDLITRELKRCADEMASTDISMQAIKEMIEE